MFAHKPTIMTDLRYPIGEFDPPAPSLSAQTRATAIDRIAALPLMLRAAVEGLTTAQLDTRYRPAGWSVRQIVHHLADAHMQGYLRTRLALTEDRPRVKTYEQPLWAELADAQLLPPEVSLALLEALHSRWTFLLRSLPPSHFTRTWIHPQWGEVSIDQQIALVSWHGRHHNAQITALRSRMRW